MVNFAGKIEGGAGEIGVKMIERPSVAPAKTERALEDGEGEGSFVENG